MSNLIKLEDNEIVTSHSLSKIRGQHCIKIIKNSNYVPDISFVISNENNGVKYYCFKVSVSGAGLSTSVVSVFNDYGDKLQDFSCKYGQECILVTTEKFVKVCVYIRSKSRSRIMCDLRKSTISHTELLSNIPQLFAVKNMIETNKCIRRCALNRGKNAFENDYLLMMSLSDRLSESYSIKSSKDMEKIKLSIETNLTNKDVDTTYGTLQTALEQIQNEEETLNTKVLKLNEISDKLEAKEEKIELYKKLEAHFCDELKKIREELQLTEKLSEKNKEPILSDIENIRKNIKKYNKNKDNILIMLIDLARLEINDI